jgi:hypothetical protein
MAPLNLNGEGMCVACINGDHKTPGSEATGALVAKGKGKQGELCNCPCHLPKSLLAPKKQARGAPTLQTRITDHCPMLYIDAKS